MSSTERQPSRDSGLVRTEGNRSVSRKGTWTARLVQGSPVTAGAGFRPVGPARAPRQRGRRGGALHRALGDSAPQLRRRPDAPRFLAQFFARHMRSRVSASSRLVHPAKHVGASFLARGAHVGVFELRGLVLVHADHSGSHPRYSPAGAGTPRFAQRSPKALGPEATDSWRDRANPRICPRALGASSRSRSARAHAGQCDHPNLSGPVHRKRPPDSPPLEWSILPPSRNADHSVVTYRPHCRKSRPLSGHSSTSPHRETTTQWSWPGESGPTGDH
jgi:hypothetical protein